MGNRLRWQSPLARAAGRAGLNLGTERDTASRNFFASGCQNSRFLPLFSSDAPATLQPRSSWDPGSMKDGTGGSRCRLAACATLPASFCLLGEGSRALCVTALQLRDKGSRHPWDSHGPDLAWY